MTRDQLAHDLRDLAPTEAELDALLNTGPTSFCQHGVGPFADAGISRNCPGAHSPARRGLLGGRA